jgi:sec-independent protein translocase protein TatA
MPRGQELIIILVVLVLLFGARKLPELARSLGASAKEFRKGIAEGANDGTDVEATDSGDSPKQ